MSKAASQKPAKPYPDFPLTAHPNGQWVKKVRGRLHYFGPWSDPDGALKTWLDERDDLRAGRKPKRLGEDGPTLGYALDHFLSSKSLTLENGEIGQRSYNEYVATCDRIAATLDKGRPLADIDSADLDRLRAACWQGKNGKLGATSAMGHLTRMRMVFLHANEELELDKPIRYRKALKSPSRKEFRKLANERGERMFTPEEIRAMLARAKPQLRAMIYLGINCGFGNGDCASLPLEKLHLAKGWHTYARPKTHNKRRCPLWPETIKAIKEFLAVRSKRQEAGAGGLVFVTKYGNSWADTDADRNDPIAYEMRKLLKELGIYRKNVTSFYSLRRTFETIGARTGEQVAVDHIMGHITYNMASVYRQEVADAPLKRVTNYVRKWLLGGETTNAKVAD